MSRKDFTLILVTIFMVILLIVGFIYDRTPALIERTTPIDMTDAKIVESNKVGMIFYRRSYQVKIKINEAIANELLEDLAAYYNYGGYVLTNEDYQAQLYEDMSTERIHPYPGNLTSVWVLSMNDPEKPNYQLTYIVDYENDDCMYLYIYFNR